MRRSKSVAWNGLGALLLAVCTLLEGCHAGRHDRGPVIEFSRIPPAAEGGRERVDTISGRVTGARPGQQIVIYVRSGSGPWWVQPWPDHPFIPIHPDMTWSTETHLGLDYAALLVEPGYHPQATIDLAPTLGGPIVGLTIAKGVGYLPTAVKPLQFSGYDWQVRTIRSDRGGLNNPYDPSNAWTDASGALHLRITKKSGEWTCAEMKLTRSLGYGTYIVAVRDISHLEPAVVFGMLTWDTKGADQSYREMDTEISRWGDAKSKYNAQYGIQPFYIPGNVERFSAPSGPLTHSFHWEAGRVSFKTVRGSSMRPGAPVVAQQVFTSGVPTAGDAKFYLNLYVVASDKSPVQKDTEVVIDKFEYLP